MLIRPPRRRGFRAGQHRAIGQHGAMVLMVMLASVLVAGLGAAGVVGFAVAVDAAHAQNAADAVAHDVEVQLLGMHPWEREDLSVAIQANAEVCVVVNGPSAGGDQHPDHRCLEFFAAAEQRLASDTRGAGAVLALTITADRRDLGSGRGTGRLEVVAMVVLNRHLPGCAAALLPRIGESTLCWAQAQAAAHAQ